MKTISNLTIDEIEAKWRDVPRAGSDPDLSLALAYLDAAVEMVRRRRARTYTGVNMTDIEKALSEIKRRAVRTDLNLYQVRPGFLHATLSCICITEDALREALKEVFGDDSVLDPEPSAPAVRLQPLDDIRAMIEMVRARDRVVEAARRTSMTGHRLHIPTRMMDEIHELDEVLADLDTPPAQEPTE